MRFEPLSICFARQVRRAKLACINKETVYHVRDLDIAVFTVFRQPLNHTASFCNIKISERFRPLGLEPVERMFTVKRV